MKRTQLAAVFLPVTKLVALDATAFLKATPQENPLRKICREPPVINAPYSLGSCTQAKFESVIADDNIKITTAVKATESPLPPLTTELMSAAGAITHELWPDVPIIPQVSSCATDGRFLNSAGILDLRNHGRIHYNGGSNAHRHNKRMPLKSL